MEYNHLYNQRLANGVTILVRCTDEDEPYRYVEDDGDYGSTVLHQLDNGLVGMYNYQVIATKGNVSAVDVNMRPVIAEHPKDWLESEEYEEIIEGLVESVLDEYNFFKQHTA